MRRLQSGKEPCEVLGPDRSLEEVRRLWASDGARELAEVEHVSRTLALVICHYRVRSDACARGASP
jgi:hypothetical protein